jgi:hypothetical protein
MSFLLLEDGASHALLEDASGALLLEGTAVVVVSYVDPQIGSLIAGGGAGLVTVDPQIGSLVIASQPSPVDDVDPDIGSLILA